MTDRRTLLFATGRALFEQYGYRGVSVADIVQEAGLSIGTFYNHFGGKEAFYSQLIDRMETDALRSARQIVDRLHSPMNQLRALYRFITLGLRGNPILLGVLIRSPKYAYPGLNERLRRSDGLRPAMERLLSEIIREGTRKGVFRSSLYSNPTAVVTALFDAAILHLNQPDSEELLRDLLVFLQRGLRRALRLRRRDERLDRRLFGEHDEW